MKMRANSIRRNSFRCAVLALFGLLTVFAAADNTLTNPSASAGCPIYNLGGSRVAFDNSSLWSDEILSPISYDYRGLSTLPLNLVVLIGAQANGAQLLPLAGGGLANRNPTWFTFGDTNPAGPGGDWVNPFCEFPDDFGFALYPMSGILNVPTPEPSTMVLACLAAADANSVSALATLGTTWSAIASTEFVNADDNTGTNPSISPVGVPIYTLENTLIAATDTSLWSGTIANPISNDETGSNLGPPYVWTGTGPSGSANLYLGGPAVLYGAETVSSVGWTQFGVSPPNTSNGLYAISGVLTVPYPTPEPSTMFLACLAAAGLAVTLLRRRRNRNS